jgi:zinc protease
MNGSTRPEDLETALQLIHLGFTRPTEDPEAFAALKAQVGAFLANRLNSPDQVFADSVNAINTGGLWLRRVPTAAQVSAQELKPVLEAHRRRFANAADFRFFLAGNFDVEKVLPMLERYLGSLPSTGKRSAKWNTVGPRFPAGVTEALVQKGVEPKGSVVITYFTAEPIEELDQHRANTAASILMDHLRSSLRELLGGTYGVGVRFQHQTPLPGFSSMTIQFGCDPTRADTLVKATLAEVRRMVAEGPTAEDLRKEQEVQRRELETSLKQNNFWIGSLQTITLMGWDPLRLTKRRERIDRLTPEALHDTYRRYFPADHYSVVRLAPETKPTP